eukprot:CAMPEP_0197629986 /NCGR_PEP_ID=MMETSP1338-20131121/7620_1 /TAXON_ID=43686 ORGANISM="Pelagodinium beii, Strain RCC1491" /NCGR_SAMPLE_ID=MMETSP1338 /ASSEMBLY_ACC=CAM_ASM_000754 /LENGTH=178 /DNA_ID=CAMNT_0043201103 /DNA_START=51 /DNA_END=587 /DNA_ORIENTATION=-
MDVFVSGYDFETSEITLEKHFAGVGAVNEVRLLGKGSAIVGYQSMADAQCAVDELNNSIMEGNSRYLDVRLDKGKGKGGGRGTGKNKGKAGGKGKSDGKDSSELDCNSKKTGTVAMFVDQRGYGFISPDDGDKDIYVHFSAIQSSEDFRSLRPGQTVSYSLGVSRGKGRGKAVFVEAI